MSVSVSTSSSTGTIAISVIDDESFMDSVLSVLNDDIVDFQDIYSTMTLCQQSV